MKPDDLKRIALLMAVNCVRNTVIEDYHAQGKLSDAEMMAFNREVANKIYTFLTYMIAKPTEDWDDFLGAMSWMYPRKWDQPRIDPDFAAVMKMIEERRSPPRRSRSDKAWSRPSLAERYALAVEFGSWHLAPVRE